MERWAKHRRRAVRKQVVVDESQGPVQTRRHRRPPLRRRAVNQIILRVEIALRACGWEMHHRFSTFSLRARPEPVLANDRFSQGTD